jgi:hypothetical protein
MSRLPPARGVRLDVLPDDLTTSDVVRSRPLTRLTNISSDLGSLKGTEHEIDHQQKEDQKLLEGKPRTNPRVVFAEPDTLGKETGSDEEEDDGGDDEEGVKGESRSSPVDEESNGETGEKTDDDGDGSGRGRLGDRDLT